MNSFEIVFYKTSNNICPVKDFLLDTDIKMRAKTFFSHGNSRRIWKSFTGTIQ